METRAHHVLIGLFVLLACVAAMLFGLWLSKSQNDDDARPYRVVFNESVRGLSVGSRVEYNGIVVGNVTALALNPANPSQVLARIRVRGNTLVRQDTVAALTTQGLTGQALIQLSGGGIDSPVLESSDGQDPIIAARVSSMARLLGQGEQTLTNLNALTLSARQTLSSENAAHLERILSNLARVTTTLAAQDGEIGATLSDVRGAAQQVAQTFADVQTLAQNLQNAIHGRAPRIADNLDKSAAALADLVPHADALLRELRVTLAALHATLERVDVDPAGYLLNRSPLPEFTP